MATEIRATYRRVFLVKPYETETVEVGVVQDVDPAALPREPARRATTLAELAKDLHSAVADVGDQAFLDRLAAHRPSSQPGGSGSAPPAARRPSGSARFV